MVGCSISYSFGAVARVRTALAARRISAAAPPPSSMPTTAPRAVRHIASVFLARQTPALARRAFEMHREAVVIPPARPAFILIDARQPLLFDRDAVVARRRGG